MSKRVAIIGAMASAQMTAAIAATGSQVEIVGNSPKLSKYAKRKKPSQRIKKQWYTVDSPEVKRMSKGK